MADKVVVYWRDIPAQVIVKAGRKTAKRAARRAVRAGDRPRGDAGQAHRHGRLSRAVAPRATRCPAATISRPRRRPRPRRWRRSSRAERLRELVANGGNADRLMYAVRLWSVRHAGFWERFYRHFERAFVAAGPLLQRIGFERLEAPAAAVERKVKGLLFDCQMCGSCVLSSTGMSCPMNCPKQMRNGPCGGVRAERPLRGQAGDALRLGAGLGRLAADGGGRPDHRAAAAGRPSPQGQLGLAARSCASGCG